jgi:CheY-like chemotaxis protein/two-component sensor histidine kinase
MQQSLFDAFDAAKRVDAIVRDLRLFSRSDEESDSVDVHGVLESTLRMARAAIRDRAHITRQYAAVPLVEASESRLGQVFLNLIINAAQALPEGDADTQEIRVSTLRQPDGRVRVEITDTGCGIPPEVARRLFTPFLTTKPVGVGTGLGLTICQRIVQALGGEISFESVVGRGTTFRVVLPPARRARVFAPPRSAPKPALRRGRVLIIDDELIVGSMLAKSLGRDHETVHDTDARCALARLRADPNFDVILCDLMMPKMGGAELYEALVRELPALAARVIFLTGGAFTDATNEFLEHIPNLHLRKPVNMADLRGAVNERVGA